MGLNVHFLTQNLSMQLYDGCSGEEVDCTMQFIPPGLQKEWDFAAGGHPGHFSFSFQGFPRWAVLLRKNHLGDLLGPCRASAMGYLQGNPCAGRVSSLQAWPQEAKLSEEHPQEESGIHHGERQDL